VLSQSAGRNVGKPQLHALFALPTVDGDMTCRMQDAASIVEQSSSKRLSHGPKCNGIDEFSIAGPESCAHMAFTDRICINECVGWKRKHWFWVTGAVGTGSREHIGKRKIETTGRNRTVNRQCDIAARNSHRCGKRILEEGAKGSECVFFQRNTGGHGMTPAFEE
jgi:hypothetical protein